MMVRHDAQITMTLRTGRQVLDTATVTPDLVESQQTVWAIMCGGISGYTNWNWLGKQISRPKVKIKIDPNDVLKNGELCSCPDCLRRK